MIHKFIFYVVSLIVYMLVVYVLRPYIENCIPRMGDINFTSLEAIIYTGFLCIGLLVISFFIASRWLGSAWHALWAFLMAMSIPLLLVMYEEGML